MFINFSNHSSARWSSAQKDAALKYGDIVDLAFPAVPADAPSSRIDSMAEEYSNRISFMKPTAVMCQGEFTLAFGVISRLIAKDITVVAACSERNVIDENNSDGSTYKQNVFTFRQFREYV